MLLRLCAFAIAAMAPNLFAESVNLVKLLRDPDSVTTLPTSLVTPIATSQYEIRTQLAHYLGFPITQATVDTANKSVKLYLYTRAHSDSLSLSEFSNFISEVKSEINSLTNSQGTSQTTSYGPIATQGTVWVTPHYTYHLEWSHSHQPEYLALHVRHTGIKPSRPQPKHRVTQEGPITQITGIPHVTQAKGYCVPATVSRLTALFGQQVDQHLLAQLFRTDATGTGDSIHLLKRHSAKLNLKIIPSDFTVTDKAIDHHIKDGYRLLDKKPPTSFTLSPETIQAYTISRKTDTRKQEHLFNTVRKYIDQGTPLLWDVNLALSKFQAEDPASHLPTAHVRLIVGYNTANRTLLYSDTWHKQKANQTIPIRDAYVITLDLNAVESARLRL